MRAILASAAGVALLFAGAAMAQQVTGSIVANGEAAELKYAVAQKVDSFAEKGYMDVIVVLSDHKLSAADPGTPSGWGR